MLNNFLLRDSPPCAPFLSGTGLTCSFDPDSLYLEDPLPLTAGLGGA